MIRLEVQNESEEVVSAYNLDTEPGAVIRISGFHGSSEYQITEFDRVLAVKFTGVTSVEDAPKEIKVEPITTEDGVTESDAEAMQRTMAEEEVKRNEAKAKKAAEPKHEEKTAPKVDVKK